MSEHEKKLNKIKKNVLDRYEWDDKEGNAYINDFLQLSKAAEELKVTNSKIYTMFMSLLKDKIMLEEECMARGERLSRFSKQEAELRNKEKEKKAKKS